LAAILSVHQDMNMRVRPVDTRDDPSERSLLAQIKLRGNRVVAKKREGEKR
jgi:hypothetical protein